MRILVLSLLRLGDLIQQKPLFEGIRARYPGAEIHLLANRSVRHARGLFPAIDVWHDFDRDLLQKTLGTAEWPVHKPLLMLEELLDDLRGEAFDEIWNFTHTRLSAYLMESIPAPVHRGLRAHGRGFETLENRWLRYFNDHFSSEATGFHYVEFLAGAFGLPRPIPVPAQSAGSDILIQPLTGDSKKNWGLDHWRRLADRLHAAQPGRRVKILGAPFEKEALLSHFEEVDVHLCELGDLAGHFATAGMLLTGDTSIKHLAAQAGVPVFELALGSSQPFATGVHQEGGLILASKVACAPCPHSGACRRPSHECGESLRSDQILAAVLRRLEDPTTGITEIFGDDVQVIETVRASDGGWIAFNARWSQTERALFELDRRSWLHWLDGEISTEDTELSTGQSEHLTPAIQVFAIETANLSSFVASLETRWTAATEGMMNEDSRRQTIEDLRAAVAERRLSPSRERRQLADLADTVGSAGLSSMQWLGALRRRLDEIQSRLSIRTRMISVVPEAGGAHERSPGKLPERGLGTP